MINLNVITIIIVIRNLFWETREGIQPGIEKLPFAFRTLNIYSTVNTKKRKCNIVSLLVAGIGLIAFQPAQTWLQSENCERIQMFE